MKKRILLAAMAASALMVGHAEAAIIYSQNFDNGLNANEQVSGDFGVSGGTMGHQSYYYPNLDRSTYQLRLDLTNATSALLSFDYDIHSELTWDGFNLVYSTDGLFSPAHLLTPTDPSLYHVLQGRAGTLLGGQGMSGYHDGRASFDLSHLVGQIVDIRLQFASDGGVLGYGLNVDNLTVTGNLASAVPEPATWAMMITGFGLAGGAIRSRRRVALVAA